MGVQFVRVVTKEEEEQGTKLIAGCLAVFLALVALYFAVAYWKITLVVIGVAVLAGVLNAVSKRLSQRRG